MKIIIFALIYAIGSIISIIIIGIVKTKYDERPLTKGDMYLSTIMFGVFFCPFILFFFFAAEIVGLIYDGINKMFYGIKSYSFFEKAESKWIKISNKLSKYISFE